MARLIGFIANRPDLCNRLAERQANLFRRKRAEDHQQWAWGVGFVHRGELLLKRRPIDDRHELDLGTMIADVRSDIMIAHIRHATVGSFRTENTHPFRYRQWMFADTGTVDNFDTIRGHLVESLPKFLQRSLRGDTDSEVVFHLFLSFLHDAGQLERPVVDAPKAASALRSTMKLLERMTKETRGDQPLGLNSLIACPDYLVASRWGGQVMGYREYAGRTDFAPLFADDGPGHLRIPDLDPCRLTAVASDFRQDVGSGRLPEGWNEVENGTIVTMSRTKATVVETE